MIREPMHHVYDSNNRVIAHSLSTEELEETLKPIEEEYEVISLDPPNYSEASY